MTPRLTRFVAIASAIGAALCCAPVILANQKPTAADAPTPRDATGHPDLNGIWIAGVIGGAETSDAGDISLTLRGRSSPGGVRGQAAVNFERDNHLLRRMNPNKPLYRPEFWERVRAFNDNASQDDPSYGCMPLGVPRMGPPNRIVQLPRETIFFYSGRDTFREIPTDGRPHSLEHDLEGTWMGEGRGQWSGDTFLVDSVGFTDASWLDIPGYFHSEHMHVTEAFTRQGNTLTWTARVDDPSVLLKSWTMNRRVLRLNSDPNAILGESLPCSERDLTHLVTKENH